MVFFSVVFLLFGYPEPQFKVVDFGLSELTKRGIAEAVLWGFLLVLPVCVLLSQFTKRLVVRRKPSFLSYNLWSSLVFSIVGDLLLEVWIRSASCISYSLDHENTEELNWLIRSWGIQCASTSVHKGELPLGSAVVLLLGIRLLFMSVGVYIGQSFMPIALTGSIATGTF